MYAIINSTALITKRPALSSLLYGRYRAYRWPGANLTLAEDVPHARPTASNAAASDFHHMIDLHFVVESACIASGGRH